MKRFLATLFGVRTVPGPASSSRGHRRPAGPPPRVERLESREVPASAASFGIKDVLVTLNAGAASVGQSFPSRSATALGADLPVLRETIAQGFDIPGKLRTWFSTLSADINNALGRSPSDP